MVKLLKDRMLQSKLTDRILTWVCSVDGHLVGSTCMYESVFQLWSETTEKFTEMIRKWIETIGKRTETVGKLTESIGK